MTWMFPKKRSINPVSRSRSFYTPLAFQPEWERFVELCRHDGVSASSRIRELVGKYVRSHEPVRYGRIARRQLRLE
ncbi:MAG: hypothetical protein ACE5OY_00350, partial [Candidatus Bathyarchaeia archaeon]